jgi:hypothetical protein
LSMSKNYIPTERNSHAPIRLAAMPFRRAFDGWPFR